MSNSEVTITGHSIVDNIPFVSHFKFIGSFDTLDELENIKAEYGDIAIVRNDDMTYLYHDEWVELGSNSIITATVDTQSDYLVADSYSHDYSYSFRDIKVSTCPHCAATLPLTRIDEAGICTCEYCGSPVYVY